MKANSLPSILDSDNDADHVDEPEDASKSPSSTASYGKKKKSRPWRYLQRQRTTEEMSPLEMESRRNIVIADANQGLMFAAMPPVAENNGVSRVSQPTFLFLFI